MNRNIFITNIEYVVSDKSVMEVYTSPDEVLPLTDERGNLTFKCTTAVKETLKAEELWHTTEDQFGNRTTYRTAIGMSSEVQEALGMYHEEYEKNIHEVERLRIERDGWSKVVNQYLKASFWQRVKWTFTGGYL